MSTRFGPSIGILSMLLCCGLVGCPEKRPGTTAVFADQASSKPTSQPANSGGPFANNRASGGPAEKNVPLPLPTEGHNSVVQLSEEAKLLAPADQGMFERAYRLTFTVDRGQRIHEEARRLYEELLQKYPKFGPAYRGIAYLYVDNGFQTEPAIEWYKKAIAADPNYGPAHYGLSFIFGGFGRAEEGYRHFQQAMKLGIKDERDLKSKFFKDFNEGIKTH